MNCQDFVFNNYNSRNSLYAILDRRIKITSDVPVKALVQVIIKDGINRSIGDMYLAYPVKLLGSRYLIKLPKGAATTPKLISFSALDYGQNVIGTIAKFVNGEQVSIDTFNLVSRIGGNQAIYVSDSTTDDVSYKIVANQNIVVVASTPCVDLSFSSGGIASDSTSDCDYAAFTALPIQEYDCHSQLSGLGDVKIISTVSTALIYELPNIVDCSKSLVVYNYQSQNNFGNVDRVSVNMGKSIPLNYFNTDSFSSRSAYTQIRTTRLGGKRAKGVQTIVNAFLTNVLDMSQAITGYTPFYNIVKGGSTLEVCGLKNLQQQYFQLNDQPISLKFIRQINMPSSFEGYTCFIIIIEESGYNVFFSDQMYVAYISGINSLNSQSSYGYAIGFSTSTLTSISIPGNLNPGGEPVNGQTISPTIESPTPLPIITTTKSSATFKFTGSLILAMLLINL
uniref:Transmembrane protein n=1 Tax=Rhabditophanes sp. KR3021 TaxID=114890 RepID=A0AC35UDD8_9BILA